MSDLALRGRLYTLVDDPFLRDEGDCVYHESDGLILIRDGIIQAVGAYERLKPGLPDGCEIRHYPRAILLPGFIDAHIH